MSESSPRLVVPAPPMPLGRRASELTCLLDTDEFFALDMVPVMPECIAERLTPQQQAKYDQDAAFAVDVAAFAVKMVTPEKREELQTFTSISHLIHPSLLRKDSLSNYPKRERHSRAAILGYGMALIKQADEHMQDSTFAHLRRYHRLCQRNSGSDMTLSKSYRQGIGALVVTALSTFNRDYYRLDFTQSPPDVLRNSLPLARFIATIPPAKMTSTKEPVAHRAINTDGGEYLDYDKARLKKAMSKLTEADVPDSQFLDRTNNRCPALAPVRGISSVGAIEFLYLLGIDSVEARGDWE